MIRHPYTWLTDAELRIAFVVVTLLTLVTMAALLGFGASLQTEMSPQGILSFELVTDVESARRMVEAWSENGRLRAALSLGVDYLFMPLWAGSIGMGCALVAGRFTARARRVALLGAALAWAQLAGALLDAVENYALIQLLLGSNEARWPVVARSSAIPKFAIAGLGLAYVLVAGGASLALRRGRPRR